MSVSQNPEVSVLKAQHAAEIYQYHNTIQTLNLKLLAMAKENALEELYSIHERELQLLEFKIQ